ncbi:MAG: DUF5615 family PIN-like protein [Candidatus Binatia bacterium]
MSNVQAGTRERQSRTLTRNLVASDTQKGLSDEQLWPQVQREGRLLVTADKGFADLREYPPGSHAQSGEELRVAVEQCESYAGKSRC